MTVFRLYQLRLGRVVFPPPWSQEGHWMSQLLHEVIQAYGVREEILLRIVGVGSFTASFNFSHNYPANITVSPPRARSNPMPSLQMHFNVRHK